MGTAIARVAPVIHARTEGNPLFMVNVVDYLVAQGAGGFDASTIEPPRTIRQMIERNLEAEFVRHPRIEQVRALVQRTRR